MRKAGAFCEDDDVGSQHQGLEQVHLPNQYSDFHKDDTDVVDPGVVDTVLKDRDTGGGSEVTGQDSSQHIKLYAFVLTVISTAITIVQTEAGGHEEDQVQDLVADQVLTVNIVPLARLAGWGNICSNCYLDVKVTLGSIVVVKHKRLFSFQIQHRVVRIHVRKLTNLEQQSVSEEELTHERDDAYLRRMPSTVGPSFTCYALATAAFLPCSWKITIASPANSNTEEYAAVPDGWKLTSVPWIASSTTLVMGDSSIDTSSTTQCQLDKFVTCPRITADTTVPADFTGLEEPGDDLIRFQRFIKMSGEVILMILASQPELPSVVEDPSNDQVLGTLLHPQPEPNELDGVVEDLSQVQGALLQLINRDSQAVCNNAATNYVDTGMDMHTTHMGVLITPINSLLSGWTKRSTAHEAVAVVEDDDNDVEDCVSGSQHVSSIARWEENTEIGCDQSMAETVVSDFKHTISRGFFQKQMSVLLVKNIFVHVHLQVLDRAGLYLRHESIRAVGEQIIPKFPLEWIEAAIVDANLPSGWLKGTTEKDPNHPAGWLDKAELPRVDAVVYLKSELVGKPDQSIVSLLGTPNHEEEVHRRGIHSADAQMEVMNGDLGSIVEPALNQDPDTKKEIRNVEEEQILITLPALGLVADRLSIEKVNRFPCSPKTLVPVQNLGMVSKKEQIAGDKKFASSVRRISWTKLLRLRLILIP